MPYDPEHRLASSPHRPARLGWLSRVWRELRRRDDGPRSSVVDAAAINIAVGAGFAAVLALLVQVSGDIALGGESRKFVEPVALFLCSAAAVRLRARVVALLLGGLGAAASAEALADIYYATPVIQGAAPHFALIAAGIGGVFIGAVIEWARHRRRASRDERGD